jgi:hypothetical protein
MKFVLKTHIKGESVVKDSEGTLPKSMFLMMKIAEAVVGVKLSTKSSWNLALLP